MIFKEAEKLKFVEADCLWRYIDLHKLIDLAINRELHFTRTDLFPDPFEGVTYRLLTKRHVAKFDVTNPSIDQHIREKFNARNRGWKENYVVESVLEQKTQFINCWIRSQRESVAMWNLYSNRNSIAIKANALKLVEYFRRNLDLQPHYSPKYEFICGNITYMRLNPLDLFDKTPLPKYSAFKKDVAYEFESEFRLLIATPSSQAESNPKFLRHGLTKNFF